MPEGLGPRLAVETGFLIALAVVSALADLEPLVIVLVMAIGWILVVLVELLAWRARPVLQAATYEVAETALAPMAPVAEAVAAPEYVPPPVPAYPPAPETVLAAPPEYAAPPPEVEPAPAPGEAPSSEYDFRFARPAEAEEGEETVVSDGGEAAAGAQELPVDAEPPAAGREEPAATLGFEATPLEGISQRLPPLQPRPRRRWYGLRPRVREERVDEPERQDTAGEEEKI